MGHQVDRVGEQVGNYRLEQMLGSGGFAEVYLGRHVYLDSPAAIKLLHTNLAQGDIEGFRSEAVTLVRLIHPHIVRILDFGLEGNTPFLVMDYAPNGTLRQRYARGEQVPLTLVADLIALADLVQLPGREAHDQMSIVGEVKSWLMEQTGWLLILDNVDDLSLLTGFLPTSSEGHILLTTRAQAMGRIAESIAVEELSMQEGMLLLLRRAKLLAADQALEQASHELRAQAEPIVRALDGLPLALDQAGAYIEETRCSLSEYLALYRKRRAALHKRESGVPQDYPHTVASTWSISFQQVERRDPAAAANAACHTFRCASP